ncbi:aldolase catalytic domain-containing protein [Candidatus Riflebacteria bacterium]
MTKILDCTIRDGGYLNNWHFDKGMVKELFRHLSKTGIDYIEIGFRSSEKYFDRKEYGLWRFTDEELLNELFSDLSGTTLGLMVDLGKVDLEDIPEKADSLIGLYRVAAHKHKVEDALKFCEELKAKGYQVALNLMGISGYNWDDFDRFIPLLSKSNIDFLYFADSYGSLFPDQVKDYIQILKQTGKKLGFHPHNNLQLAFANTLEAMKSGIHMVDATIYGIGRAAGNLALETLIGYLVKSKGLKKLNNIPILDFIDKYFTRLRKEHKWGYSIEYMLSGMYAVHPNYSKTLLAYHEYEMRQLGKALEVVNEIKPVGFNKEILKKIINSGFLSSKEQTGEEASPEYFTKLREKYTVKYVNRHEERDFLILANGHTLRTMQSAIQEFINKYNPIVMGANNLGGLFVPYYHAFANKRRFEKYINTVNLASKLLISSSFEDSYIASYTDKSHEKIVHIDRLTLPFVIKDGVIGSHCRTVSVLLAATAIVMGAKRIFIAGMDGYKNKENFLNQMVHFYGETDEAEEFRLVMDKHDQNEEILKSINNYLKNHNKEELHIITPTTHEAFYTSIENFISS